MNWNFWTSIITFLLWRTMPKKNLHWGSIGFAFIIVWLSLPRVHAEILLKEVSTLISSIETLKISSLITVDFFFETLGLCVHVQKLTIFTMLSDLYLMRYIIHDAVMGSNYCNDQTHTLVKEHSLCSIQHSESEWKAAIYRSIYEASRVISKDRQ